MGIKARSQKNIKYDGTIRVQREVKGRKGKPVTVVSGLQIDADELKNFAAQLKRRCGTGGSVKDGVIIIQDDFRDTLITDGSSKRKINEISQEDFKHKQMDHFGIHR